MGSKCFAYKFRMSRVWSLTLTEMATLIVLRSVLNVIRPRLFVLTIALNKVSNHSSGLLKSEHKSVTGYSGNFLLD